MNENFNVYEEKEIEELAECGIFEELRKEQEEEAWEDIEDMYEEFEDSMPCDLYGGCAGSACRNWYNCHN